MAGKPAHCNQIAQERLLIVEQLHYATQLLAVAAISCAKGSAAMFVHQIVGIIHRRIRYSLLAAAGSFAVFAVLGAAFQCSGNAPRYWLYTPRECNNGGVEYAILVFSMFTDLWISVVALPIIWKLQTATSIRIRAMTLLGARLL